MLLHSAKDLIKKYEGEVAPLTELATLDGARRPIRSAYCLFRLCARALRLRAGWCWSP